MRTRIAHTAAIGAAISIAVTMIFLVAAAGHPDRPARTGPGNHAGPMAPVAAGWSNPSLGVRGHHESPGSDRRHVDESSASSAAARAWGSRADEMSRMVDAWRAAHPAPPAPPKPALVVSVPVTDATSTATADWACIRLHESGDRYNTPAAPGGAYGFLEETWLSLGYGGWPYQAQPAVQSQAALYLYNELGWQPWSTRVVCGL